MVLDDVHGVGPEQEEHQQRLVSWVPLLVPS